MKRRHFWRGIASLLCMGVLILDSRTALEGAREGIELCTRTLIPSLFPFFVLSRLITGAFTGVPLALLRPLGKLLGIPSGCEGLLIPAFLGGYPAGAQCIGQALRSGSLSDKCASRLLLFCNNAGPSFFFGVLGTMFPRRKTLWSLWVMQFVACVMCALLIPQETSTTILNGTEEQSLTKSLSASVKVMGSICGWVVLVRILLSFMDQWFLWLFPVSIRVAIMGFLELSNGCLALERIEDLRVRYLLCCTMLSFGGLCVGMQTASVVQPISVLPYIVAKGIQCLFCLGISGSFLYHKPSLLVLTALFWFLLKKVVTKHGSVLYNASINQRRKPYAVSKENRAGLPILSARHSA